VTLGRRGLIQRSVPLRGLEALLFSLRRFEVVVRRHLIVSDRTRGRSTPVQRGTFTSIVPILRLGYSLFHPPELFFKRMGVLDDWLRLLLAA
jgi:hypothetical protein